MNEKIFYSVVIFSTNSTDVDKDLNIKKISQN